MNFELGSEYRYEYKDLPEINEESDVEHYIEVAKNYFPKLTKVRTRTEKPKFNDPIDQVNWEREEIRRCIEGYDGLSGKMYFYYNYCKIKNISGGIIRPDFRVMDAVWFHLIEAFQPEQYLSGHGVICIKRRRSGFSWKEAADVLHDAIFQSSRNIGMTSKSEDDAKRIFGWVQFIYERLPSFMKIPMSSQAQDKVVFARKEKDVHGNKKLTGPLSTIYSSAPSDDCFEGDMLTKMIIDEVGKIKNVTTIWSMSEDTMMQETEMLGIPVLFGTAGEQDPGANGVGQKQFWNKHKDYSLVRFFTPGWSGLYVDDKGNDDVERAVKWVLEQREKKLKISDEEYHKFLQKYPLNVKEALLSFGGSGIGNIKKIRDQEYELEKNPVKFIEGKFRWGYAEEPTVVFEPNTLHDTSGKCRIYEQPSLSIGYCSGCDPADHDYVNKGSSDLSMYIMSHQKGMRPPKVVFSYTDRPDKVNDYYEQAIMALVYYNNTMVLIENNRNGMIQYFQNNGYIHLLKPEPQQKNVLNTQSNMKIGIRKTTNSGKEMERCINEYTNNYCDVIPEIELLQDFMVYGSENTDRAIAFGWTLVSMEDEVTMMVQKERSKSSMPSRRLKKVEGKLVRVNIK